MAQRILNNGDTGLDYRTKSNDNFTELFETALVFVATKREVIQAFTITTTPTTVPFSDVLQYAQDMTYDVVTGIFTNVHKGVYIFDFFMSGNWGNGTELFLTVWVDGVQRGVGINLTGQGSTKNIPLGIPTFAALDANQTIEIKCSVSSGSTTLELVSGSVGLALKVAT